MISEVDIDRAIVAKGGLYDFVELAWPLVETSPFVPNWHLEEMCLHLEAVSRYEIRDLVINIPPGCSKSLITSVFWPAWEWILNPESKFFYASFDASLTRRDARKEVKILGSDWYRNRWGNRLEKTNPAESDFNSTAGGFRFSTSIRGKGTGRHPNFKVVDDPIKPLDASGGSTQSKTKIKEVSDWWGGTMASRSADRTKTANVLIMQRLNEDDLAGECVAKGYEHLCFPMRFESSRKCVTSIGGDRRTEEGELLSQVRFSEAEVAKIELAMGPDVSAAQLQQRPTRQGGNIFKHDQWKFWTPSSLPKGGLWIQSWDCAFKGEEDSDFVCGQVWLASYPNFFLVWQLCERLDFTGTVQAIRQFSKDFPFAYEILIEDKANGPAVESTLKNELRGISMVNPLGGKIGRARAVTPLFAAGRVFIPDPNQFSWVRSYMGQHESFPRAVNDDMVDATSQALMRLRDSGDSFTAAMAKLRGEN